MNAIAKYDNEAGSWTFSSPALYNGGVSTKPSDIDIPKENMNYASDATRFGVLAFAGMSILVAVVLAAWTIAHQKVKIVRHSQAPFLLLLCFGCIVSSSAIFSLSVDDMPDANGVVADQATLDMACQASVWCYSLGFIISFSALFAKTYRAYVIFSNKKMKRITITTKDMILPIVVLVVIDGALLLWWTMSNPLVFKRTVAFSDAYGNPVSSNGACQLRDDGDSIYKYVAPIAVIHGLMLIVGNVLAYLSRTIPGSFQESKYIGVSMVSTLQIFIIGLPVLVIVADNAEASLFIRSAIIFLNDFGVLCLIFLPKVLAVHGFITIGDQDANSTTKTSMGKTSTGSKTSSHASSDSVANTAGATSEV
jgi:gamma-aminobutyric acid type B receptor